MEQPFDPLLYGSPAWLADLPVANQTAFVREYVRALQMVDATGFEAVE